DCQCARCVGRFWINADLSKTRFSAFKLCFSAEKISFRLLDLLLRDAPDGSKRTQAIAISFSICQLDFASAVICISCLQIRRIKNCEWLILFDPLAKLHLQLRYAACEWGENLDQP